MFDFAVVLTENARQAYEIASLLEEVWGLPAVALEEIFAFLPRGFLFLNFGGEFESGGNFASGSGFSEDCSRLF